MLVAAGATVAVAVAAGVVFLDRTVAGHAVPEDTNVVVDAVDPAFIQGTDSGEIDRLAAATLTEVQAYWRRTLPGTFDTEWRDLRSFHSIDTADPDAEPAPCSERPADIRDNAFFCPGADAIAWDRAALFPDLVERYGQAGVVVVLAHEVGHAVHNRLGVDTERQRAEPQTYPTIVVEAMADCYAGAFVRWVVDGNGTHLRISRPQLDAAVGALVSFRDPVGTTAADRKAHGNAFDRVSSFADGYRDGPRLCAGFNAQTRQFTLRRFTDLKDEERGGNLDMRNLQSLAAGQLEAFFGDWVRQRGGSWADQEMLEFRYGEDRTFCAGNQGPVTFCPNASPSGTIGVLTINDADASELLDLHDEIGDYATGTLLASRYGLAALAAIGQPIDGPAAGTAALCLAGGFTGSILDTEVGFGLSPGDLDEAVLVLLRTDYAARDSNGTAASAAGFERVETFRGGTLEGADSCELPG